MKSGLVWLERSASHLRSLKRELLDANEAAAYWAVVEAIRTLETLARELRAAEYVASRKRRAKKTVEVVLPDPIAKLERAVKLLRADDEIAA
jgi:hypothetical protein